MKKIGVKSIGWYLPEKRLINEDLEGMAATTGQWMLTRTGIQERRIAGKHIATSAMAVRAARAALETAALQPADWIYHLLRRPPWWTRDSASKKASVSTSTPRCLSDEYLASALQIPSPFYFVRLRAALARRGPEILRT